MVAFSLTAEGSFHFSRGRLPAFRAQMMAEDFSDRCILIAGALQTVFAGVEMNWEREISSFHRYNFFNRRDLIEETSSTSGLSSPAAVRDRFDRLLKEAVALAGVPETRQYVDKPLLECVRLIGLDSSTQAETRALQKFLLCCIAVRWIAQSGHLENPQLLGTGGQEKDFADLLLKSGDSLRSVLDTMKLACADIEEGEFQEQLIAGTSVLQSMCNLSSGTTQEFQAGNVGYNFYDSGSQGPRSLLPTVLRLEQLALQKLCPNWNPDRLFLIDGDDTQAHLEICLSVKFLRIQKNPKNYDLPWTAEVIRAFRESRPTG